MAHVKLVFSKDRAQESFADLKANVFARLRDAGTSPFAGPELWVKGVALFAIALSAYVALVIGRCDGLRALGLGAASGVALLLFALNVSHDAAHHSFSGHARIDELLLFLAFAPLGVDPVMWRARHLHSHHRFPNVDRCDADIDENPFIRLSPNQPWRAWHRFQHGYAWALYAVVALHAAWIQDFVYMRRPALANMDDWPKRVPTWTRFAATKAVHVVLVYVLPLCLVPAPAAHVLASVFAIQAVVSLLFILPLIGTHFSSAAQFPETAYGRMNHSYVTHQIVTSVDWRPDSKFANGLFGGLNAHAAHHLFPRVSHGHYHWISEEIAHFCRENELKHNAVGFRRALKNHYEFLRALARAPAR